MMLWLLPVLPTTAFWIPSSSPWPARIMMSPSPKFTPEIPSFSPASGTDRKAALVRERVCFISRSGGRWAGTGRKPSKRSCWERKHSNHIGKIGGPFDSLSWSAFKLIRPRAQFWTKRKGLERDLAPGLGLSMADILEHIGRGSRFWTKRKSLERDLAPDLSRWERRIF